MKVHMKSKLQELRADYSRIRGGPFINFYCPILFRDEGVHLCEAHMILGHMKVVIFGALDFAS